MTTIAYCDGYIISDTQLTHGDEAAPYRDTKITQPIPGLHIAYAGTITKKMAENLPWSESDHTKTLELPREWKKHTKSLNLIIIDTRKGFEVYSAAHSRHLMRLDKKALHTIGSGASIFRGAYHAFRSQGLTNRQALIESMGIAAEVDIYTSLPYQLVKVM